MSAPAQTDSVRILRWTTVIGAAVLGNYLCWALALLPVVTCLAAVPVVAGFLAFLLFPPVALTWPSKLLLLGLLLVALSMPTTDWDGRSIWLFRAKRIYLSGDLYAPLDGYAAWSKNDYPTLVASLSASFARCLGFWNEVYPKSANVFVAIPAVLLLASVLRSRAQELLLGCVILFLCGHSLVNGYMDGLLALYFTAAGVLMSRFCGLDGCKRPNASEFPWLVSAGVVIFAILTLLKNEGAVGLLVLAAVATALCRGERRFRDLLLFWVMVAIASIPLICWKVACVRHGIQSNLAEEGIWARLTMRLVRPGDSAAIAGAMLLRIEIILPLCVLLIGRLLGGGGRTWWFPAITCAIYQA